MYFYLLKWSDHEYIERHVLYHEEKISQKEFEALVKKLAAGVFAKIMKNKKNKIWVSEIVDEVAELLLDLGFHKPKFEAQLSFFYNIDREDNLLEPLLVKQAKRRNKRVEALFLATWGK